MVVKIKKFAFLLYLLLIHVSFSKAQLIINEVSQGPLGSKEYVELLVVGQPTCSSIPCLDLRGYYIDDNNGNQATGTGTGIAQGCVRFTNNVFWSCIPIGTLIVIYNDADVNAGIPSDDISMTDGNCKLVIPVTNCALFEENISFPSISAPAYPTTGFTSCATWSNLSMANGDDSFQTINPAGNAVFSVSWGNNTINPIIYFSGTSATTVAYMANTADNDPSNQANWTRATTVGNQTPGAANNAANALWISTMNNSCTALTPLVVGISSTNTGCTCDGTATVTASGANPPYTYSWAPSGGTAATATGLCAGSYTVTVTSANGCIETATEMIIANPGLTVTVNSPTICAGQTATLTATGGTSYLWSTGATTGSITDSPATTTSYTVTGSSGGCSGTAVGTVTVGSALVINANSETICAGQSATLTATGGTTYQWSTGATTNSITDSPATTTSYTVTGSSGGCSGTAVGTVTVGNALVINVNSETICTGQPATLTATGGTTYQWSTGATTNSITDSPATTTSYTVTGSSGGCSGTVVGTVTVGSALAINVNSETICTGQPATLTATGATTYLWSTGATTNSITDSPATTTSYTVTGSSGGCSGTVVGTVTVGSALAINVNSETICTGQPATLTATGATTYLWSTGATTNSITDSPATTTSYTVTGSSGGCSGTAVGTVTVGSALVITVNSETICTGQPAALTATGATTYLWSTGATTNSITDSPATTTSYTVTGSSGGCSGTAIGTVTVGNALAINVNSETICAGQPATLTATGGTTYVWSTGATTNSITDSPATTTSYTVTGSSGGCSGTAVSIITVNPQPDVVFTANTLSGCEPFCTTFTDSSAVAGGSIVTWNWDFGGTGVSNVQHPQHCFDVEGQYSISLTVSSNSGCIASFTSLNMIELEPFPVSGFSAPLSVSIFEANVLFTDNSSGASSWSWNFGDVHDSLENTSSLTNPSHTYSDPGTYCINLVISNNAGCVDTSQHCIVINQECTLYIPNAFSPNGDGFNDEFYCKGENINDFEMLIYNRWGDMIFSTNDINEHWNGKANKGEDIAQQDVYVYVIVIKDNKDERFQYIGNVTVVR